MRTYIENRDAARAYANAVAEDWNGTVTETYSGFRVDAGDQSCGIDCGDYLAEVRGGALVLTIEADIPGDHANTHHEFRLDMEHDSPRDIVEFEKRFKTLVKTLRKHPGTLEITAGRYGRSPETPHIVSMEFDYWKAEPQDMDAGGFYASPVAPYTASWNALWLEKGTLDELF